jgi:peptidoglycan biosynthesis protein MviN/MurJ (putative lipid II flippase)
VIKQAFTISSLTLLSTLLGFCFQFLLALVYGKSLQVDTFFFVSSWPVFIAAFISASLSFYATPVLSRVVFASSNQVYVVFRVILYFSLVSGPLFAIFAVFFLVFKRLLLPENSPMLGYSQLDAMIVAAWIISFLQVLLTTFGACFNSLSRHKTAALLPLLPTTLTLLYFVHYRPTISQLMFIMAVTYFVGLLVALCCLFPSYGVVASGLDSLPAYLHKQKHIKAIKTLLASRFLRRSLFVALGATCFSSWALVDSYWAPRSEPGAISLLAYSQRIIIGVGSLIISGSMAISIPKLSVYLSTNSYSSFRHLYKKNLLITVLCLISSVVIFVFAAYLFKQFSGANGYSYYKLPLQILDLTTIMLPGAFVMVLCVVQFRVLCCFNEFSELGALSGFIWTFLYFAASSFMYSGGVASLGFAYSLSWLLFGAIFIPASCNYIKSASRPGKS